jgi:predicted metalloprotease
MRVRSGNQVDSRTFNHGSGVNRSNAFKLGLFLENIKDVPTLDDFLRMREEGSV